MAFPVTSAEQIARSRRTILWTIWSAMLSAVFVYQMVLGHGVPQGRNAPGAVLPPIVWFSVAILAIATAIRWFVIPRVTDPRRLLVAMIAGIALSESVEFYSLFLVPTSQPETKLALWVLAVLGIVQFMPVYASPTVAARDPFRAR